MKLLSKNISKEDDGSITLQAQTDEDMWHCYHLVAIGDAITAVSTRKIANVSSTGSVTNVKKTVNLTIGVEEIEYDTTNNELRVKGKIIREHKDVKIGVYHTISIGPHTVFTLEKPRWDKVDIQRVNDAVEASNGFTSEIAMLLMQMGTANLFIVSDYLTRSKAHIECHIPRKTIQFLSSSNSSSSSSLTNAGLSAASSSTASTVTAAYRKFFGLCLEAIQRHIKWENIKVFVVASPGYLKDDFVTYVNSHAIQNNDKTIMENRSKLLSLPCSTAQRSSIQEILTNPSLTSLIDDTKYRNEMKKLDTFYETLAVDSNRAFYGLGHVTKAVELKAVDCLLISDETLRQSKYIKRDKLIALMDECKKNGAEVIICSTSHQSGEMLNAMGGVAAILRFPVEEALIAEEEDEDDVNMDAAGSSSDPTIKSAGDPATTESSIKIFVKKKGT